MYANTTDLNFDILYQGDILKNFPFFIFPEKFKFLTKSNDENKFILETSQKTVHGEQPIMITVKLTSAILLSQTCDIQQRENIVVAPVYTIETFKESGILSDNKVDLVKKRRYGYLFYLPKLDGVIDDSIVYLQTIHYLPKNCVLSYKNNKIATMSDWGRHHLAWALSNYFGRPIEEK